MMSKLVLSIEQMQHLQELGLEVKETLLYWARCVDNNPCAATHYEEWALIKGKNTPPTVGFTYWEFIPAYTLQDVLELLPHIDGCQLSLGIDCDPKMIWYEDVKSLDESGYETDGTISFNGDTMLEVAYKSLVWAIKEGYLETDKHK